MVHSVPSEGYLGSSDCNFYDTLAVTGSIQELAVELIIKNCKRRQIVHSSEGMQRNEQYFVSVRTKVFSKRTLESFQHFV